MMVQIAFPEKSQNAWKKGLLVISVLFMVIVGGILWLNRSSQKIPTILHKKETCIERPSLTILQELESAAKNDKLFLQKTIQQVYALNGNADKVDQFANASEILDPLLKAFVKTSYDIMHKKYDLAFTGAQELHKKLSREKENVLYGMNLFRLITLSNVHASSRLNEYCEEFSTYCESSSESAQRLKQCLTFKGFDVEQFISSKSEK